MSGATDGITAKGAANLPALTAKGTATASFSARVQQGKKRRGWWDALKALAQWGAIMNGLLSLAKRLVRWLPELQEGLEQALRGLSAAATRWKRTATPAV